MKKMTIGMVVVAAALLTVASAMAATISPTISVSAAVVGQCKANANGSLAFGTITPGTTAGVVNGTPTAVTIKCANGLPFTVVVGSGGVSMTDGATHTIPYTFSLTTASGTGAGFSAGALASSIAFTGSIAQANYDDAWTNSSGAGVSYTDTVTLTVTF